MSTTKLQKLGSMLAFILLASIFFFGITRFSRTLKEDSDKRVKHERMQYLKDSLTVESLKQQLNEKEDTCEYSNDRVVSEDMGLSPYKSNTD